MSSENLTALMDKWTNDPEFREALRADPEKAIRASGLDMSQNAIDAVKNIDWKASDEELATRISKRLAFF